MPERTEPGLALRISAVSKRLGGEPAVADVSLEVEAGEFLTLLGPSGSGKSTTLNLVAGFLRPDSGEIHLDGRDIVGLRPHKRNIGMVFQHYALFPHMTVFHNVAFPLRERKVARSQMREKVEKVLDMVRLSDFAARYPAQLSGGQQQRVALARAMVFDPGLLLMDEPLGALDRKLREWLQLEIKRIHREVGITFVYVTHDQEEALVLSDRIAIFNGGRIEQVGTPEELYEQPKTAFVAEFVGESNLFVGAVTETADGPRLDCGDGLVPLPLGSPPRSALMVRPERVAVAPVGADRSGGPRLQGTVGQIVYLGSTRRIEVELDSGRKIIAREIASESCAIGEGEKVSVTWSPGDGVAVDGGGAPVTGEPGSA